MPNTVTTLERQATIYLQDLYAATKLGAELTSLDVDKSGNLITGITDEQCQNSPILQFFIIAYNFCIKLHEYRSEFTEAATLMLLRDIQQSYQTMTPQVVYEGVSSLAMGRVEIISGDAINLNARLNNSFTNIKRIFAELDEIIKNLKEYALNPTCYSLTIVQQLLENANRVAALQTITDQDEESATSKKVGECKLVSQKKWYSFIENPRRFIPKRKQFFPPSFLTDSREQFIENLLSNGNIIAIVEMQKWLPQIFRQINESPQFLIWSLTNNRNLSLDTTKIEKPDVNDFILKPAEIFRAIAVSLSENEREKLQPLLQERLKVLIESRSSGGVPYSVSNIIALISLVLGGLIFFVFQGIATGVILGQPSIGDDHFSPDSLDKDFDDAINIYPWIDPASKILNPFYYLAGLGVGAGVRVLSYSLKKALQLKQPISLTNFTLSQKITNVVIKSINLLSHVIDLVNLPLAIFLQIFSLKYINSHLNTNAQFNIICPSLDACMWKYCHSTWRTKGCDEIIEDAIHQTTTLYFKNYMSLSSLSFATGIVVAWLAITMLFYVYRFITCVFEGKDYFTSQPKTFSIKDEISNFILGRQREKILTVNTNEETEKSDPNQYEQIINP